jgi:hypothetical protein
LRARASFGPFSKAEKVQRGPAVRISSAPATSHCELQVSVPGRSSAHGIWGGGFSKPLARPASGASSRRCSPLFDYLCEPNAIAGNPVGGVKGPMACFRGIELVPEDVIEDVPVPLVLGGFEEIEANAMKRLPAEPDQGEPKGGRGGGRGYPLNSPLTLDCWTTGDPGPSSKGLPSCLRVRAFPSSSL